MDFFVWIFQIYVEDNWTRKVVKAHREYATSKNVRSVLIEAILSASRSNGGLESFPQLD